MRLIHYSTYNVNERAHGLTVGQKLRVAVTY